MDYQGNLNAHLLYNLPVNLAQQLYVTGWCDVTLETIEQFISPQVANQFRSCFGYNNGYRTCRISSNANLTAIFCEKVFNWRSYTLITMEMLIAYWFQELGPVRDQGHHELCWAYVAADQTSANLSIRTPGQQYITLSVWDLCRSCRPDRLGREATAQQGHMCYREYVYHALIHIAQRGLSWAFPSEDTVHFFCSLPFPLHPDRVRPRFTPVVIPSLWEALRYLPRGPISADIVTYSELFNIGDGIYRGPTTDNSTFLGYHACSIGSIMIVNGELVAVCKLSNGPDVGMFGYVKISLSTIYMIVDVSAAFEENVGLPSPQPAHLLANFVVLDF